MKKPISHEKLIECLDYNPQTGVFAWKVGRPHLIGKVAGSIKSDGYQVVKIDRHAYPAGHLAWFYVTGKWPAELIDHRNGVRSDNSFGNLREATGAQNSQNYAMPNTNTSGYLGVTWNKSALKWQASIKVNGKLVYLGIRTTAEEAHQLYLDAKCRFHTFQPVPREVSV